MSLEQIIGNIELVKDALSKLEGHRGKAEDAANLLDKIFEMDSSDSEDFNVKEYLTGDAPSDASIMRTHAMHKALLHSWNFTEVVGYLYKAAQVAGGIIAVFA